MSQNTQVVNFVRIKSWYIPADAESYLLLKSVNFPLCKVSTSMLPALQLAMQPKGIRAKAESFADSVLHPYFDKLGEVWHSKEGRKCKITDNKMSFHAPSTKKNKEAIRKLDDSLTRFFARWGFSYAPVYSDDGNGKCKLTVEFRFDQNKTPVIPTVDTTPPDCVEFILGFTKLKITFGRRREANPYGERQSHLIVAKQVGVPFHLLEVYNQAGADWVMVHSSTFVDNTVGDVKPWLETMAQLAVVQATLNPQ
jgi:hypothetical protein